MPVMSTARRLRMRSNVIIGRRPAILAAAGILAAGLLSVVTAGPAAAQTPVKFCLTNASSWCMSISFVQAGEAVEMQVNEASDPAWEWTTVSEGTYTFNGQQWPSFEIQDGILPTYCLQNTTLNGSNPQVSDLASCSANGTVWIQVKDSNGYYLVSRYALRTNGNEIVLGGILQQDSALLGEAPPPVGPLYEQWTAFAE
jgi:hypothetical protein